MLCGGMLFDPVFWQSIWYLTRPFVVIGLLIYFAPRILRGMGVIWREFKTLPPIAWFFRLPWGVGGASILTLLSPAIFIFDKPSPPIGVFIIGCGGFALIQWAGVLLYHGPIKVTRRTFSILKARFSKPDRQLEQ